MLSPNKIIVCVFFGEINRLSFSALMVIRVKKSLENSQPFFINDRTNIKNRIKIAIIFIQLAIAIINKMLTATIWLAINQYNNFFEG